MQILEDYRCECGKLLCKGQLIEGTIEIKCRRCGSIERLQGSREV